MTAEKWLDIGLDLDKSLGRYPYRAYTSSVWIRDLEPWTGLDYWAKLSEKKASLPMTLGMLSACLIQGTLPTL